MTQRQVGDRSMSELEPGYPVTDEDRFGYEPFDAEARDSLLWQRNTWRGRAEDMQRQLVHYRDHRDIGDRDNCEICRIEDEELNALCRTCGGAHDDCERY